MQYMLLIVDDRDREVAPEEMGKMMGRMGAWAGTISDRIRGGSPLHGIAAAARVEQREGDVLVTDGPFAESKEVIAGYFIIEADSREEAVEMAKGCPHTEVGPVEVREVIPVPSAGS